MCDRAATDECATLEGPLPDDVQSSTTKIPSGWESQRTTGPAASDRLDGSAIVRSSIQTYR